MRNVLRLAAVITVTVAVGGCYRRSDEPGRSPQRRVARPFAVSRRCSAIDVGP